MPFPLDGFRLPAMNCHRLHYPRMLCKPSIHACFPDIGHLLTAFECPHRAVFLQRYGVLRGADLTAVVEGEQKNEDVCGHADTFIQSFAAAVSASGKSGYKYLRHNVSVVSLKNLHARLW